MQHALALLCRLVDFEPGRRATGSSTAQTGSCLLREERRLIELLTLLGHEEFIARCECHCTREA